MSEGKNWGIGITGYGATKPCFPFKDLCQEHISISAMSSMNTTMRCIGIESWTHTRPECNTNTLIVIHMQRFVPDRTRVMIQSYISAHSALGVLSIPRRDHHLRDTSNLPNIAWKCAAQARPRRPSVFSREKWSRWILEQFLESLGTATFIDLAGC